jgi:hypothetical protein
MAKPKKGTETHAEPPQELSDEDRLALLMQHKQSVDQALAGKKAADAKFKNACRAAKAELGKHAMAEIDLIGKLDSEEGETEVRESMARMMRVAKWMGSDIGTQFDLGLGGDAASPTDAAKREGKLAHASGQPRKPPAKFMPGSPDYEFWMKGYDDQALATSTIGRGKGAAIGTVTPSHQQQ